MKVEILSDADQVARQAAEWIARALRAAPGPFTMAVSGGQTPWVMMRALATMDLPWEKLHVFQVDERIAPAGDADRNLTHLRQCLPESLLPPERLHAMPVEVEDLEQAAARYAKTLEQFAGSPPVLDLVHLGMGNDGHTASLVPGDPVLVEKTREVAITGVYQGRKRMTLTYPVLNRARGILWLVTGASKQEMLNRLIDHDPSIPAGRIAPERALVLADRAAMLG